MNWGTALALAFGVMKSTDIAKELFDRVTGLTPQPYLKSAVATGLAVAAACTQEDDWRERLVLASGIAGAAAVLHEGYAVLSSSADSNKVMVVSRQARAAVQGMAPSGRGNRVPPL